MKGGPSMICGCVMPRQKSPTLPHLIADSVNDCVVPANPEIRVLSKLLLHKAYEPRQHLGEKDT